MLITEWGDNGHWQTTPFSMISTAAGAFTAWHGRAPQADGLRNLFDGADAAVELGNLYQDFGFSLHNNNPAFPLIRFSNPSETLAKWSPEKLADGIHRISELIETLPQPKEDVVGAALRAGWPPRRACFRPCTLRGATFRCESLSGTGCWPWTRTQACGPQTTIF